MAEPGLLDHAAFDAFDPIDPSRYPAFFDPDLFSDEPDLLDDCAAFDGLDVDLDLDLDLDLDYPIEDLLANDPPSDHPPSSDDASPSPDSGVSSDGSRSSRCADPASSDSEHSTSCLPGSDTTVQDVKAEEERDGSAGVKRKKRKDSGISSNPSIEVKSSPGSNSNCDPRPGKILRSEEAISSCLFSAGGDDDDKRKARLMRNRESAQLSRQRKKHYVEELEDKVKAMHSTIADLNGKMSYIMAENASLRQQLGAGAGNCPPPMGAVYPPLPGQMAPVHFPWIPGYAYRTSGAPLVPIPRLKTQQPAPAPKARKSESKKAESKTKKVASISLLGLLFVMLISSGLFSTVNLIYGGSRNSGTSGYGTGKDGIGDHSQGRVLTVSGRARSLNSTDETGLCSGKVGIGDHLPVFTQNSSESLPAMLYVPRNGKHVKINGNLIIHSVLATEKAMAENTSKAKQSTGEGGKETSLAIPGNLVSALTVSLAGKDVDRHAHSYTRDSSKTAVTDGPLQQWFREGLAGPILSSGMCTEVFQFTASPSSADPGGIVPASSIVNATKDLSTKSAHRGKMKNRRILYPQPIPLPGSTLNDTEKMGKHSDDSNFQGNTSAPPMVVSILADPREAGDGDIDGTMSPKSLSRVFVVVLLDSVKYVTYSCALPFKSSSPHLVN